MPYDVSSYKNCNLAGKRRARIYLLGGLLSGALVGYYLGSIKEPKVHVSGDINVFSVESSVKDTPLIGSKIFEYSVKTKNGDKVKFTINGKNLPGVIEVDPPIGLEKQQENLEKKTEAGNSLEADIDFSKRYYKRIIDLETLSLDDYIKKYPERFKFD